MKVLTTVSKRGSGREVWRLFVAGCVVCVSLAVGSGRNDSQEKEFCKVFACGALFDFSVSLLRTCLLKTYRVCKRLQALGWQCGRFKMVFVFVYLARK